MFLACVAAPVSPPMSARSRCIGPFRKSRVLAMVGLADNRLLENSQNSCRIIAILENSCHCGVKHGAARALPIRRVLRNGQIVLFLGNSKHVFNWVCYLRYL